MADRNLCQARVWDNGDMTACGASMPCAGHATDRKPWREDIALCQQFVDGHTHSLAARPVVHRAIARLEAELERAEREREHLEYAAEVCRRRIVRNSSLMTDRRTAWEQGARQGFFCRPDGDPDPTTLEEVLSYNPYPEAEELLARFPRPNGSRWVPTAELMPTDGQALLFLMTGSPKVWVGRVDYAERLGLFFRTDYGDFMPEVVEWWLAVPEPPPR